MDIQLECMDTDAYDPIKKHVYVSDSCHKRGSIFRIKTTGNAACDNIETIVASTSEFDLQTTMHSIKYSRYML